MPFWLASIVRRVLVAFVPAIVLLIPGLRVLPSLYRLRIRLRLYRWYRALLALERAASGTSGPEKRRESLAKLDHIENEVNRLKVPASFADQFYGLREHIQFVRGRLAEGAESPLAGGRKSLSSLLPICGLRCGLGTRSEPAQPSPGFATLSRSRTIALPPRRNYCVNHECQLG